MKRAASGLASLLVPVLLGFFTGIFVATLIGTFQFEVSQKPLPALGINSSSIHAIFSPGASLPILREIASANSSLDVMLYQFSLDDYEHALAAAVARGVAVRIILEPRVDSNFKTAEFLSSNGVSVRWASREYTNTHSKTMVVDGRRVLVGSVNWSRNAAKSNRESAVVIDDGRVAGEFLRVFEEDWAKAGVAASVFPTAAESANETA